MVRGQGGVRPNPGLQLAMVGGIEQVRQRYAHERGIAEEAAAVGKAMLEGLDKDVQVGRILRSTGVPGLHSLAQHAEHFEHDHPAGRRWRHGEDASTAECCRERRSFDRGIASQIVAVEHAARVLYGSDDGAGDLSSIKCCRALAAQTREGLGQLGPADEIAGAQISQRAAFARKHAGKKTASLRRIFLERGGHMLDQPG